MGFDVDGGGGMSAATGSPLMITAAFCSSF